MTALRGSRRTRRPSLGGGRVVCAVLGFVAFAVGGCGGSTGRDGTTAAGTSDATADAPSADAAASDAALSDAMPSDATLSPVGDAGTDGTVAALDEGLFDVDIPHADRLLPDVHAVPPADSGLDAPESGARDAGAEDGAACVPYNTPGVTVGTDGGLVLPASFSPDAATYACTPTEQRFVDKSVACYQCLINGSCLDDAVYGDMGKECEDLTGNATIGNKQGHSLTELCQDVLECIFRTKCAATDDAGNGDVARCYCGSLLGSACATSMEVGNGPCADPEATGAQKYPTDPASVVSPTLADVTLASGKADAIFACAQLNGCAPLCSN